MKTRVAKMESKSRRLFYLVKILKDLYSRMYKQHTGSQNHRPRTTI